MPTNDQIQTILQLARTSNPTLADEELYRIVEREHSIDLSMATEEQLDTIMEALVIKKKAVQRKRKDVRINQPTRPKTPLKPHLEVPALTDFVAGNRVKHVKMPEWGDGHIVGIQPFQVGGDRLQKLDILFAKAGRKIIIVRPGMLEIISPAKARSK